MNPRRTARTGGATILLASSLALTSCGTGDTSDNAETKSGEDTIEIVASTSIWGNVAEAVVAGTPAEDTVEITAVVEGNDADPHHFEPSAADIARATEADIVVVGGGGYDAWLYDSLENKDNVIHALPLTTHSHDHEYEGHDHEHGGEGAVESIDGNEHVWYDTDALSQVAEDIAKKVGDDANAEDFTKRMDALHERTHALPKKTYAQTEPIADYILEHSDMEDKTPKGYRSATLSHGEPTAADLNAFLEAIKHGDVDVLIYNPQTKTDLTERIRKAAEENNVKVMKIGETPPDGTNFLDYFDEVVTSLEGLA
ncbi:zinc ABC transporter substrate-binding protein [Corynebacterium incognita]|uniref:Zinc ABC transporter substrate-binding protein n=2 Tax=Corynebacterium incognita TaxID=2754725 RepID=A0A7G7CSD3_9CORY|nr:zinc ABC transporter substrate-binding protein [Corynebacterium incognita]